MARLVIVKLKERMPKEFGWRKYYRIIPSRMPTVNYLEKHVGQTHMGAAFEVESITNDRLRSKSGKAQDIQISGTNASVVMAAFTHVGNPSRFSDGSYGVFYAANSITAAIKETVFHRERFLRYTDAPARVIEMRCYTGYVCRALIDVRHEIQYHNPDIASYPETQKLGAQLRQQGANGILYQSVRHPISQCIASFIPKAITLPIQTGHYQYHWNGEKIDRVMKMEQLDLV